MALTRCASETGTAQPPLRSLLLLLLGLICVAGAAAILADTVYLVIAYYQPLFFWDSWDTVGNYERFVQGTYSLSDLFSQHNEHRIAFPRLIFLADFVFGQGMNIINVVSMLFVQFLLAILLVKMSLRIASLPIAIISAAISVMLLFTFGQYENFTWGFQVSFFGVCAAATAAFWWFSEAAERRFRGLPAFSFAFGSLLMTIIAIYTLSNGIIVCFVLIFLALTQRAAVNVIIASIVISVIMCCLYFHDFHLVQGHSPPEYAFQHPIEVFIYILIYIGGLVGSFGRTAAGAVGAAGLAMTSLAAVRMILHKEPIAARAALVGVMLFVVATAALTAFGRVFFGFDQALASRYLTPVCVFWSAQVIYWSSFAQRRPFNLPALALLSMVFLAVVAGAAWAHLEGRPFAKQNFRNLNLASDALLSGADAPAALKLIYPDPEAPVRLARFLDQQHLSIFSWPVARLRGTRLHEAFARIDDRACLGSFDQIEIPPDGAGVSASGWAWDLSRRRPVDRIILVNSADMIVGFASGGWTRRDVRRALPQVQSKDVGWKGFAKLSGGGPVRAYAYLDQGRVACALGERAAPANG